MRREQNDTRLLKTGHYAGLKFDEGWWFIQVVGTEQVEVKPFVAVNSNGNRDVISAGTSGPDDREPQDRNGDYILEPNDDERNTVFQVLYGIAPSRMQTFHLYGRDRPKAVEVYDEPGDPAPYVDGFDSPYNNPSRESEFFYVNSMSPLRIQVFNPMDTDFEAHFSFHVNKLRYTTVTDQDLMKAMLQGQQPARLTSLGEGVQNKNQVAIPTWVREAFSEHIHTTDEILSDDSPDSSETPLTSSVTDLQTGGGQ